MYGRETEPFIEPQSSCGQTFIDTLNRHEQFQVMRLHILIRRRLIPADLEIPKFPIHAKGNSPVLSTAELPENRIIEGEVGHQASVLPPPWAMATCCAALLSRVYSNVKS